jgi:mannose-6-phosphate isomerase
MKILAIDTPCSIQVHPSPDQAHEGYTRELAAGIEYDDPHRCYVDAYDKPELLCALEPCDALVGFRAAEEVATLLKQAGCDALAQRLAASTPGELFLELLKEKPSLELDQVVAHAAKHGEHDPAWHWVNRLAALYPGDAGLFAPIFLHYVRLEPGEAVYVPAGLIHAYLHGFAVEVMGASDNVLRAGLTPKHIDVSELARVVSTESAPVAVLHGEDGADGWRHWTTDSPYFHLAAALVSGGELTVHGPAIVIAVEGSVTVSSTQQRHQVDAGRGVFVAAEDSAVIAGNGRVYACSTP